MNTSLPMCDYFINDLKRLVTLGIALLISFCLQAQSELDTLIDKAENATLEEKPALYMDLFVKTRANYDSGMFYANESRKYSLLAGDSLNYTRSEYAIAYLYKNQGYAEDAIPHYLNALNTARNNGYEDREKASLNGLALSYYSLSKFDESLKYHFESLALREKDGDQADIAIAVNNIGLVYYQLNDFDKAILYFKRALEIEKSLGGSGIEGTYINLGLAYLGLEQYDIALENFNNGIEICKEGCSNSIFLEAYNGAGACLFELGDKEKSSSKKQEAREKLLIALKVAYEENSESNLISIYNNLARIDFSENDFDMALSRLDSAQILATKLNSRSWVKKNYKLYAELFNESEDFKKAYENRVKYDSISSIIINDVVAKNLLQIQVDFEERQNLEIIALKDKEIGRRTTLLLLSIIISVLTVVIIFILYRNNKIRRRVNKKLTIANKTIENQNKTLTELNSVLEERVRERTEELRESNEALMKSNHDLDNFIYKTSHDIRGPLATLQGICNIALMDIKEPMAVDYLQKLSKTAYKLNLILSKLLVINQINNALPLLEDVRLLNLVNGMVDENKMSYFSKEIKLDVDIPKNLKITSDPDLLKIILGNLINNAFKFHDDSRRVESFIKIRSCIDNDKFIFEIIDNGVGIEESVAHQIFDIFSKTSEIQDTAGLGLYLVKLATEKLEGKIEVKKSDEGNTLFRVTLPLN